MLYEGSVTLRPIQASDIEHLRQWQSHPEIMRGWAMPQPLLSHDSFEADLAGRFRLFDSSGHFMIDFDSVPVGRIGFARLDSRHRSVELLIYIGEKSAQGKGAASNSIRCLAKYLFRQRSVKRIELTVLESNSRAIALYEHLGFRREGVLRDYDYFDGSFHNELVMSVFEHELRLVRKAECEDQVK